MGVCAFNNAGLPRPRGEVLPGLRGLFAIVGNTVRVCAGHLAVGCYDKLFLIMQSGRRGEACCLNTAQSSPVARRELNGHYA